MSSSTQAQVPSQDNEEISVDSYIDKRVYTTEGTYVGTVDEVMLSFGEKTISALGLSDCNVNLFKNSRTLGKIEFPYEWVRAVDDIIVVRPIQKESLAV